MAFKIQQGRVEGVVNGTQIAITPVADLTRAFVVAQFATRSLAGTLEPQYWAGRIAFDGANKLVVRLPTGAATPVSGVLPAAVSYFVVECTASEFLTEFHEVTIPGGSLGLLDPLTRTHDLSKSFIVGTSGLATDSAVSTAHNTWVEFDFSSTTNSRVRRGASPAGLATETAYWVVEWTGATVQSVSQTLAGAGPYTLAISAVVPGRTLLFPSFRHNAAGLEYCSLAVALKTTTSIEAQRFNDATTQSSVVRVFVVELPVGDAEVQHEALGAVGSATRFVEHAFPVSFDPLQTVARVTASSAGTGTAFPINRWSALVIGAGVVRAERSTTGQDAELSMWAAEFLAVDELAVDSAPARARADAVLLEVSIPVDSAVVHTIASTITAATIPEDSLAADSAVVLVHAGEVAAVDGSLSSPGAGAALGPLVPLPGRLRRGLSIAGDSTERRERALRRELRETSEVPSLLVGGRVYSGWKSLSIASSLDSVASSFQLEATDVAPFSLSVGQRVEIRIGADPVLTGHIDERRASIEVEQHRVELAGRSLAADLVDCSAIHDDAEWFQIGVLELATRLAAPFGVPVRARGGFVEFGGPFPVFALQQGESAWEALERACRMRGLLATSAPDGTIELGRLGTRLASVALNYGQNVLSATVTESSSERFAEYLVRGQSPAAGAFDDDLDPVDELLAAYAPEGRALDTSARTTRRLLVVAEASVDEQGAQTRAEWEAAVRAARGETLVVSVVGWRQRPQGALWEPGLLVPVSIAPLRTKGLLVIRSVRMTLDENEGRRTELELARAGAFAPKPEVPATDGLANDWFAEADDAGFEPMESL